MKATIFTVLFVTAFLPLRAGEPDPRYSAGQLSDAGVLTLHFNQLLSLEFHRPDPRSHTLAPKVFGGSVRDGMPTAFIKLHRPEPTSNHSSPPAAELYIYKSSTWRSLRFSGTILYRGDTASQPFTVQCDDRACRFPFTREVTELQLETFTLTEPANKK